MNQTYNFLDLDILGVGPVARLMSGIFDHFWNSNWVVPGYAYAHDVQPAMLLEFEQSLNRLLKESEVLQHFTLERQNWASRLDPLMERLRPGTSSKVYDRLEEYF